MTELWKEKCADAGDAFSAWLLVPFVILAMSTVLALAVAPLCTRGTPALNLSQTVMQPMPVPAPVEVALRAAMVLSALARGPSCR
jgi:hypothetical protein